MGMTGWMMRQKRVYGVINVFVLLVSAVVFCRVFAADGDGLQRMSWRTAGIVLLTVAVVHGFKAFRLYFALYGKGVSFPNHMKQYSKTVIVSMVLPVKSGDLFRAYCYGNLMQSWYSGIVLTVLDRFADTLALVTMMLLMQAAGVSEAIPLLYVLLAVLSGILVCYLICPEICRYWKRYFLRLDASVRRNRVLRSLDYFEHAYAEVAVVVKGRGVILYALSLMAWTVETGGLVLLERMLSGRCTGQVVSMYLTAALAGTESAYLKQFVGVSAVLLALLYLLLSMAGMIRKGGIR